MKNIDKIDPFDTTVEKTNVGVITMLLTEVEISAKDSISFGTQSLLTNGLESRDRIGSQYKSPENSAVLSIENYYYAIRDRINGRLIP